MGRKPIYDWARAAELYAAGCNDREIARQIGCDCSAVLKWRLRSGRAAINQNAPIGTVAPRILAFRSSGLSSFAIAAAVGCNAGLVRATFRRAAKPDSDREYARRYRRRHNALIGRGVAS